MFVNITEKEIISENLINNLNYEKLEPENYNVN